MYVPTQIEILQSATHVLILFERAHTYRIIPLDARPHIGGTIGLWQGDSRGHWEGSSLAVDVTNQSGRAWFDQAGNFYTSAAHMVERFTLIDADTIHYQVTIDDPTVYTRPWTMAFPLRRNKQPGFRLLEEACHEGERNTQPLDRSRLPDLSRHHRPAERDEPATTRIVECDGQVREARRSSGRPRSR